jgi:uncharacterized membrane protein (DUF4010 family)
VLVFKAAAIHGNKGQGRTKALAGLNGSLTALVATDIAARGLFHYCRMSLILNCLIFLKITVHPLVEQEELEQVEKLIYLAG